MCWRGQYQGAATADLDLIPVAAIDHIEVLQEGAAAQYGTDAIAGVVNIILKKNASGGVVNATGGQYFKGDGETYDFSGNIGLAAGRQGLSQHLTAEKRYRGFSQRGAPGHSPGRRHRQSRARSPTSRHRSPNYPRVNQVVGEPESQLTTVAANLEYDLAPDITLYATATYGERKAKAMKISACPTRSSPRRAPTSPSMPSPIRNGYVGLTARGTPAVSGATGTFTTPGELIFSPTASIRRKPCAKTIMAIPLGLKGEIDGWHWDLSGTYGKDRDKIYTLTFGQPVAVHGHPHHADATSMTARFTATEATFNLDVTKNFEVGLASPLTVAFGGEGRENTFAIGAGRLRPRPTRKAASPIRASSQSDAGAHSRKNYAAYIDLAVSPIQNLQVDIAGRFEHYTDFGDAKVGKITARYDITPEFAVRGTISTGFRAPTIQEEYLFGHQRLADHGDRAVAAQLRRRGAAGRQAAAAGSLDQLQPGRCRPSAGQSERHGRRLFASPAQPHRRHRHAVRLGRRHQFADRHHRPSSRMAMCWIRP